VYPSFLQLGRRLLAASIGAAVLLGAGCHHTNYNNSGYGVGWVTLGTVPAPQFAAYIVTVDSVTLTDALGNVYTALATPEAVDFTKLQDISELWGSATIPNDTYVTATIVLDYTLADIEVVVNGKPQKATVTDWTAAAAAVTTVSLSVTLDPSNQLTVVPSYSTDNATRVHLIYDMLASSRVDTTTTPATVHVSPYVTLTLAPPDDKLIRIRGALVNTSLGLGTFSIYERPFYDQTNSIGTLSIFNDANTVFTIDGKYYVGANAGIGQLTQASAGITLAAAYTTFKPTATTTGFAGTFNSQYVVAGTSLQSQFTENLSGDVIARSGNTLTVRGGTVFGTAVGFADGYFGFQETDSQVIVGPGTTVTVDDDSAATGLNYLSIGVGQHIEALGSYSVSATGVVTIDATSNTVGQVRLQSTRLYGSLVSATPGSLVLDLAAINVWPASAYAFAGNGATAGNDPVAANFLVNTGTLDLSASPAATPLWIKGLVNGFGSAPPDFIASAVIQEGAFPATLQAFWTSQTGTTTPFTAIAGTGFSLNLTNASLLSAVINVGGESVALSSLPASPQVVPTTTAVSITTYPTFSPVYSFETLATTTTATTTKVFSSFPTFVTALTAGIATASPVLELDASGTYDRATNTFTATSVSVVL
jgi:hypothetical protein